MQKMNGSNYKKIRIPKLELGNEKKSHDWERVISYKNTNKNHSQNIKKNISEALTKSLYKLLVNYT
jgi:hypothetical protein